MTYDHRSPDTYFIHIYVLFEEAEAVMLQDNKKDYIYNKHMSVIILLYNNTNFSKSWACENNRYGSFNCPKDWYHKGSLTGKLNTN